MAKFSCQLSSFPHVHHFISSLAPLSGKEKWRQRRSTNDKMVSPCHRAPCPAGPPCWNMGRHEASCVSPLTVQSSAVPHSFIFTHTSICTMLTGCPSVVLQGLYFLPCPTFIIPHIWCTLWTSCYRASHTAAQPPFPNDIVDSAPTSGPGTVFTETINYSWLISAPFLAWQSH